MPLEIFISYSHKDGELREQLSVHLSQLVRDGLILPWTDRSITPGAEWKNEIDAHVRSAQIILLLISPDFIASDYCYGEEMRVALDRHAREQTLVVPIILRPVDWQSAPFARLQALPTDARAVTLWPDRDLAFAEIAKSLRQMVVRFQQPTPPSAATSAVADQLIAKPRMVDAAMPSHIVKDRATELLVLVRLPDSKGLAGILQDDEEAEARPEDVRSRPFEVTFPLGPTGRPEPLRIAVQLTAPDFEPPLQSKNIFVPVDRDSDVCPFLLTPRKTGALLVVIELFWEDAERGYRRLKTTCVADAESAPVQPVQTVVQMPMASAQPQPTSRPLPTRVSASISAPPVSALPPRPATKAAASTGWMSGPALKIGLALCVLTVGSTYFLVVQRQTGAAVSLDPQHVTTDAVLRKNIDAVSLDLKEFNAAKAAPQPETAALVKEMRLNLTSAKLALAKGEKAKAQAHVDAAKAASIRLHQLQHRP